MQYFVFDSRYISGKETAPMFASNDRQEAIAVADEIGERMFVVRIDESGLKEIVYTSPYKSDLGMTE